MNEKLECGPKARGLVERKKIRDSVSAALLRRARAFQDGFQFHAPMHAFRCILLGGGIKQAYTLMYDSFAL